MKRRDFVQFPSSVSPSRALLLLFALSLSIGTEACSCAVGRPTPGDAAIDVPRDIPMDVPSDVPMDVPNDIPMDTTPVDAGDVGPVDVGTDVPMTLGCGDGMLDTEEGEACDPALPSNTNPELRCICPSDSNNCTDDVWVPDPVLGTCYGSCVYRQRTGYGITTCDDGVGCTVDTIMSGSPATCDVVCTNLPTSPTDTTCNNFDDDCNGTVDDGYTPMMTSCGVGACRAMGTTSCVNGFVLDSCVEGTPAASDTTCDNVDDDCNGARDDGFVTQGTTCGVGACASTGATACNAGVVNNSCVPGTPAATDTTCNLTDDDCNGMVDDGYGTMASTCGVGACQSSGTSTCVDGAVIDTCVPGTSTATDDNCDGVDDDCDGVADDDFVPQLTMCGLGMCTTTGLLTCTNGVPTDTCVPGMQAADDATCDGVDDDCDGTRDEDYVPGVSSCGVGACVATGTTACTNGAVLPVCTPGTPAASDTTCNNIDDDCNGARDDGYVALVTNCGVGTCAATGTTGCSAGVVTDTCTPGTPAASDANCNNLDENCNGTADEGYVSLATSCGVGACGATGMTMCSSGTVVDSCTPGTPAASDTSCNNIDDDCNGARDDGYVPLTTTCGVGVCASTGSTSCSAGTVLDSCAPGAPGPSDTTCNNLDENCNGTADEGYVPLATTCGVGACGATGTTMCSSGTVVDSCTPGTPAASDTSCNNRDDDCNGARDDGYVSVATTCGVGVCASTGSTSCSNGTVLDSCAPGAPGPSDTTCNNLDENCNGTADEGYVPLATTCGVGACGATGTTMCSSGTVVDSCTPGTPAASDTTCNNIDDDCNGARDDGYVSVGTSCGTGVCSATGSTSCSNGTVLNSCMPGSAGPSDTSCDGVDENCSGSADEQYVSLPTTCGVGACIRSGATSCSGGTVLDSCTPGAPAASDTTCNNVDDDCNGARDDGFTSTPTTCGVGACASTGATSCTGGVLGNSCAPGIPAASDTTCNNLDDNCNGMTDEGYVSVGTSCGVGACAATGSTSCSGGTIVNSCTPGTPAANDATCNNIDDDCNGARDDSYVPVATTCGVGACMRTGITSCSGGAVLDSCTPGAPAATDNTCDGIDDDCNGTADEDFVPSLATCGVGACAATGILTCSGGVLSNSCTPLAPPSTTDATCNNIDDDCNGMRDEDYVTTPTTCGVGACSSTGAMVCSNGSVINTCVAGTMAATDTTCNNVDDDCNGARDDGFVGTPTSCGVGACSDTGTTTCVGGAIVDTCSPGTPAASDATCNNIDDDCNGSRDEDYVILATTCGVGACASTGATACNAGVVTNSCMAGTPAANDATCNNIDDDCNGARDEDYVSTPTTCGVGACASTGATTCNAGAIVDSCTAGTPAASDTTCNNIDDDCNGARDEDYVQTSTTCGVGACASTGITSCSAGTVLNSCMPGTPAANDATCNNVDDDCNGTRDEDYVQTTTTCGVGACAATGMTSCTAGVVSNSCMAGTPAASDATCNNIDDDCNGTRDEDYVATPTSCGVGACASTGTTTCNAGVVGNTCVAGTPAASDATCNNIDDDCNGTRDEDYAPTATTCGVGACASTGTTTCSAGVVGNTCTPGTPAANDATCNNIDDDCSGARDEDYAPTPTTCGVGACASTGTTTCTAGVVGSSCVPGTPAANDTTCNNIDDDCSGARDEDYVPTPTTCGVGACASTGTTTCSAGVVGNTCTPGTPAANDTTCNNIDDDCSGARDEDYVPTPTTCGVGACASTGSTTCSAGVVGNTCTPGTPAPNDATCNNTDEDCNGTRDEDYVSVGTTCGVGACARTGTTSCNMGAITDSCSPGAPAANDATCNNIDDDCSGAVDEDFVQSTTTCGVGGCARTGNLTCSAGVTGNTCMPGPMQTETCDAVDNDCDGTNNEGNPGSGAVCTTGLSGICGPGTTQCVGTALVCQQNNLPQTEVCDGIDNNCDGAVDVNPYVTDNMPNACSMASNRTFMVAAGAANAQNISGTVDPNGDDYFVVSFTGVGGPGVTYRPRIQLTAGAGTYVFSLESTCGTAAYCQSGAAGTLTDFSMNYSTTAPGTYPVACLGPGTCTDNIAKRSSWIVRVRRVTAGNTNCTGYTIRASNE